MKATPSPLRDGRRIDLRNVGTWEPNSYEEHFLRAKVPFVIVGEPQIMNRRLIAQSGTFIIPTVLDLPIEDILAGYRHSERFVAKIELDVKIIRDAAMRHLYSMNITPATLFPDLDGLARSMAYELEYHWAFDPKTMDPYPGFPARQVGFLGASNTCSAAPRRDAAAQPALAAGGSTFQTTPPRLKRATLGSIKRNRVMNRKHLQQIARLRLKEARALQKMGLPAGAFYLAGYSIECAFKACIAKQVKRHDFPDKATVEKSWKHDLKELVKTAGLEGSLNGEIGSNPQFSANWGVVKEWNETSRYSATITIIEARDMIRAISARTNGVLQWITQRW